MKKIIILVATLVLITVLFTACTYINEQPMPEQTTYKGLNGEVVTDLGEYGASRIIASENIIYDDYNVIELISADEQSREFLIIFSCKGIATEVWGYMYGLNEQGTIDDTWRKQEIWY